MTKGRLEAFSDGVLAIAITIMVLELKPPHNTTFESLLEIWPVFFCYILSFANVALYWNNHHHLLQAAKGINGSVLWANMLFLFFISLMPFFTAWMGENNFENIPVAVYGFNLLCCAVAYAILVQALLKNEPKDSLLTKAINKDFKGKLSIALYLVAIPLGFFISQWIALIIYVGVFIIWFIPDKRIETKIID